MCTTYIIYVAAILEKKKNLSYMFFHLSIVKVESKLSNNFPCLVSQIQLSLFG